MRGMSALALTLAVLASSHDAAAETVPTGMLPDGVEPTRYSLSLDVDPRAERFGGEVRIDVKLAEARSVIWLHGKTLDIEAAAVETADGARVPATYAQVDDSGVARLEIARPVGPGAAVLALRYSAAFNKSLEGLYQVRDAGQAYAYTQFEALSARRAFPGFDEPRFKTPFDIAVTVTGDDVAVSNAPVREIATLPDGRRRVTFATTKPLPTYLIALAVGDFDVVEAPPVPPNAVRDRALPLRGIAPKGKGGLLAYAFAHTAPLLDILEDYFGIPYPYPKLDLVVPAAFSPGGMENAGAIFYRQDVLLLDEHASVFQRRGFAYTHAHELSHMWFGDLVTPAWWDDLWLNESFATWMANRVVHAWRPDEFDDRGPVRGARWAMWSDRLASARQIRQPVANHHDVADAFDGITYSKGGAVLAMVERYMGADAFREGVRRYMRRHRYGTATAEDFFAAISEVAGDPGVIAAFRSFVEQPGAPFLGVDWSCDSSGAATVTLEQSRGLPLGSRGDPDRRWSIPVCLAWPDGAGRASRCLLMTERTRTEILPTRACPAWILPNEDGAAYLNFSLPAHGWQALTGALDRLRPAEALAVVGSAGSAFEAGGTGPATVLDAAAAAARSPHWDVVEAPMQGLRDLRNLILPESERPAATALMRRIYSPALARLDLSDAALAGDEPSPGLALLRADLIWFMAVDAEDPALRTTLARLGRTYLGIGSDGAVHREVLHPDLVRVALIVAAKDGGQAVTDALVGLLRRSDDAVLRGNVIAALGHQTDRATLERVQALILDPAIPKRDAGQLLRRQGRRVANQDTVFRWIVAHYDDLQDRLPRSWIAGLPWRVSAFCSRADRDRVSAFFSPRAEAQEGGPRALANVLEAIDVCAAVAESQRAAAIAAVAARQ